MSLSWIFSVACLAVAGYYTAVLITHSWTSRGDDDWGYHLSHLAMALGMAAMFSPLGDPVPPLVWSIVFGLAAAWFAACLLRAGTPADGDGVAIHRFGPHHLIANLAMLFMVVGGHQHGTGEVQTGTAAGGSGGAGHEGHLAGVGGGWFQGTFGVVLTVVLAGYFLVHTVRSLRVLFSAPTSGQQVSSAAAGTWPGSVVVARRIATPSRVHAASHVVMGAAMTVMFGLML